VFTLLHVWVGPDFPARCSSFSLPGEIEIFSLWGGRIGKLVWSNLGVGKSSKVSFFSDSCTTKVGLAVPTTNQRSDTGQSLAGADGNLSLPGADSSLLKTHGEIKMNLYFGEVTVVQSEFRGGGPINSRFAAGDGFFGSESGPN
jgi:hypothetical protein